MAIDTTLNQTIFKEILSRRMPMVLDRIQQAPPTPAKEIFEQVRLTLSFACHEFATEIWSDTRNFLLTIAPQMEQVGYRDGWQSLLQQALALSEQLGDQAATAELHFHLGILGQLRTNYKAARHHLEASVQGFEWLAWPRKKAQALNQLAYVARLERRFDEATRLVEIGQQLLEVEDEERAFSYYVLGLVALDKRAWSEAVEFSEKAFDLWKQTDQRRLMGRSLLCRGVALDKMGCYPEAMNICQQAVSLFEDMQDRFYQAIAQMNLGNVYFALGRLHEALDLYLKAERQFHQIDDKLHLGHISNNIGVVYRHLQEWDKARNAYVASVTFWQENGNIERLVNVMDGLGLSHFYAKQYYKAKTIFREALEQLSKIKGEPGYEHWLQILTDHLDNASVKAAQEEKQICLQ